MKKVLSTLLAVCVLSVFSGCTHAQANGWENNKKYQTYKRSLERGYGWGNDDRGDNFLRNLFDSSDDTVPEPTKEVPFDYYQSKDKDNDNEYGW